MTDDLAEPIALANDPRWGITKWLPLCPPGKRICDIHPKQHGFGTRRLLWDAPCWTLTKWQAAGMWGGFLHPEGNRYLSIPELKRCATFPDDFKFEGGLVDAWQRIGNSVPPKFMQSIAEHLKMEVLKQDSFTVVSTFSGCGGSSLGYKLAGGKVLLAVEWEDNAAATYRLNFPDTQLYHGDIAKLSVDEVLNRTGLKPRELDILDGSPPCQGFSTAGKRDFGDDRNQLFREYCRLLKGLQPRCFIMENVSGMVKGKMKLIFKDILTELKSCGYKVKARLLNAMYFNVPQSRERMIFVGVRNDIDAEPSHPLPKCLPITFRKAVGRLAARDPNYQTRITFGLTK